MHRLTKLTGIFVALAVALAALPALAEEAKADSSRVVNVNEADAGQLALLPRVGPSLSARIVTFREENGKFKAPEDLMLVRGIGEKTFELMKPYVAVSGETTLTEKVRVSQIQRREESSEE